MKIASTVKCNKKLKEVSMCCEMNHKCDCNDNSKEGTQLKLPHWKIIEQWKDNEDK